MLGQQLIEGFGVRVTGESDVLRGREKASWSARDLLTVPAYRLTRSYGTAGKEGPMEKRKEIDRLRACGCHHRALQAS